MVHVNCVLEIVKFVMYSVIHLFVINVMKVTQWMEVVYVLNVNQAVNFVNFQVLEKVQYVKNVMMDYMLTMKVNVNYAHHNVRPVIKTKIVLIMKMEKSFLVIMLLIVGLDVKNVAFLILPSVEFANQDII